MNFNLPHPLFAFYSTGHKAGLDLMSTWLQGVQRVRQHQLEQVGAALADCERISTQSDPVRDASGLQAVQQALVRSHIERGTAYWYGLLDALHQNRLEWAEQMRSRMLQMAESLCQGINEMPAAIFPVPVASSLNAVIHAASVELSNAQERAQAAMDGMTGTHREPAAPARAAAATRGASSRVASGSAS